MLSHKDSLGKFKKIKILSSIFSDHNAMKLEINYNTKTQNSKKYKHTVTKQYAAKQPLDHQRNQRKKKKKPRDKWQWKHANPKPMGHSKSISKGEVYSNTSLPQETRKISKNLIV